jgi:hypothetical protein
MSTIIKTDKKSIDEKRIKEIKAALQPIVFQTITKLDLDNVLLNEDRAWMTQDLSDFVVESAAKFIAGQKEHGGRLINRDLIDELMKEIYDSMWYVKFELRKRRLKAKE